MKGILFGLLEEMRRCQFCIEIQEFIFKKKKLDGGDGRFWSLTVVLSFDFRDFYISFFFFGKLQVGRLTSPDSAAAAANPQQQQQQPVNRQPNPTNPANHHLNHNHNHSHGPYGNGYDSTKRKTAASW